MNESSFRINTLKEYLAENPNDSFLKYTLALEYNKLGDTSGAIALLEQLLTGDPDYLACFYQLGKIYESEGRREDAIETYEQGIEVAQKQKNQRTLNELRAALDLMD